MRGGREEGRGGIESRTGSATRTRDWQETMHINVEGETGCKVRGTRLAADKIDEQHDEGPQQALPQLTKL